jgi:hypothetical protein
MSVEKAKNDVSQATYTLPQGVRSALERRKPGRFDVDSRSAPEITVPLYFAILATAPSSPC